MKRTQTDADAVKALIEALGDVTLEKKESVEAARNAYDALSTDAKKLVPIMMFWFRQKRPFRLWKQRNSRKN